MKPIYQSPPLAIDTFPSLLAQVFLFFIEGSHINFLSPPFLFADDHFLKLEHSILHVSLHAPPAASHNFC